MQGGEMRRLKKVKRDERAFGRLLYLARFV
jgi:hypothetical protein